MKFRLPPLLPRSALITESISHSTNTPGIRNPFLRANSLWFAVIVVELFQNEFIRQASDSQALKQCVRFKTFSPRQFSSMCDAFSIIAQNGHFVYDWSPLSFFILFISYESQVFYSFPAFFWHTFQCRRPSSALQRAGYGQRFSATQWLRLTE